jgi:hypothetical protein
MYGSATWSIRSADCTRDSTPRAAQRILQRERIHERREHPHVIGGRAVHAGGAGATPRKDVAAADHDGNLDAHPRDFGDLGDDPVDHSRLMPYESSPISASPDSLSRMRL